jgi:hypothetical protein
VVDIFFAPTQNWQGMFLMSGIPGVIMLLGCFFLDNSPRWLVMKGMDTHALEVLQKSRTKREAVSELKEIQKLRQLGQYNADQFQSESILQRRFVVPFLIVFGIAALNQLIGVNSLLQLGPVILKAAGLGSDMVSILGASAVTGLNFLVTLVLIGFVDKIERKYLYGIGTAGLAIALLFCGCIMHMTLPSKEKGELLLAGIMAFIFFYAMGPGLLVWVILAELLPLRIRSSGMAVSLCANSLIASIWASVFLTLAHRFGYATVFWICGGFGVLYFVLVVTCVPKVKGQSLEAIEAEFAK